MKIISLLATLAEWNDLGYSLRSAPSNNVLKKNNLNYTRLRLNKVLNIYNPRGLKLLTRFRLGFIHLWGHKSNHDFNDCLDQICICGIYIESTNHFLLQYSFFLKKDMSSWIKFVVLTAHLLTKMKTLSVIHLFLVKKTWIAVITSIFWRFNVPLFE